MVLMLFLFGVFFVCLAMLWTEGLWGNAITYVNVILSGMIAMSFWESAANALEKQMPSFTYVLDILAVWGVFAISMVILREITSYLSKFKVRFHRLMENVGNIIMCIVVAATFTGFAGWTLHLAPLAPAPFRGASLSSGNNFLGNIWRGTMSFSSRGTMTGGNAFPSDGYAGKYLQRRQALATLDGFRVKQ